MGNTGGVSPNASDWRIIAVEPASRRQRMLRPLTAAVTGNERTHTAPGWASRSTAPIDEAASRLRLVSTVGAART